LADKAQTGREKTLQPSANAALPETEDDLDPIQYPNLAALRDNDRQEHLRLARKAGLTRKQASRHADEHLGEAPEGP
jgi:hypothetical protein